MYHLFMASPEKMEFEGEILSLIAPGTLGYLEILTHHAPIVTTLRIGKLTVTDKNHNKLIWAISGGYLEVSHNKATLLADSMELAEKIDAKRAENAFKKAKKLLESENHENEIDKARAKQALRRSENRLKIVDENLKNKTNAS
jgi:F-type H+-transporting ATPase subunit epsilon